MSLLGRTTLAGIVVILALAPFAGAQEGGDGADFVVPHMEDPSIEADGHLDASWQDAEMQQIEMEGHDGTEGRTFVQVYMIHNASHLFVLVIGEGLDTATLQFDPSGGDDTDGRSLDGTRVTSEGTEDLDYDPERGWVPDGADCAVAGEGARAQQDVSTVFETAKAFEGDACDLFMPPGETMGFRLVVTRGDESYRWPAGTDELDSDGGLDEELAGWGHVRLEGTFGDTDQDVPAEGQGQDGDPGLFTDERPGLATDAPASPGSEAPADFYEPGEHDRDTPAPGLVALMLVGVGALYLASRVRR